MWVNILGPIGVARTESDSTAHIISGGLDPDYVAYFTRAHERSGFDAVLIGDPSNSGDGFLITQHMANKTDLIKLLPTHRPMFATLTQSARRVAALDRHIDRRLSLHNISSIVDDNQICDGRFLPDDEHYTRTDKYLHAMRGLNPYNDALDSVSEQIPCVLCSATQWEYSCAHRP